MTSPKLRLAGISLAAFLLLGTATMSQDAVQAVDTPAAEDASPVGGSAPAPVTDASPADVDTPVADDGATDADDGSAATEPALADPAEMVPSSEELTAPAPGTLPHDLSPWGMFMQADIVVKAVMLGLALASLITWTIWLVKSLELAAATARGRQGLELITRSRSLDDAVRAVGSKGGVIGLMAKAANEEVDLSIGALDHASGDGLKERVSSRLARIVSAAGRRTARGTGVLATIGSTAPFVGLFGTVWGIMNAFIGISAAQTTNLAVVAPGIAEALLATAIGLVAAIPAVVIYNVFSRSIAAYRQLLGDAAAGIERLASRDLDWRNVPARTGLRATGTAAVKEPA